MFQLEITFIEDSKERKKVTHLLELQPTHNSNVLQITAVVLLRTWNQIINVWRITKAPLASFRFFIISQQQKKNT